jgi:hypothetical protein
MEHGYFEQLSTSATDAAGAATRITTERKKILLNWGCKKIRGNPR